MRAIKTAWVLSAVLTASSCDLVGRAPAASAPAQPIVDQVAGAATVINGDTIEINRLRIRLSGVDSPAQGAMCGQVDVYQRAAGELRDLVADHAVACARNGVDEQGRTIATCRVGGVDLGYVMVIHGWARDWPRHSGGRYADEERSARAAANGIWGMACPANLWGERDYSSL